jgi:hypothetical protein
MDAYLTQHSVDMMNSIRNKPYVVHHNDHKNFSDHTIRVRYGNNKNREKVTSDVLEKLSEGKNVVVHVTSAKLAGAIKEAVM